MLLMNVPTIGKANRTSTYAIQIEQPGHSSIEETIARYDESIHMTYAVGQITARSTCEADAVLTIYTTAGIPVLQKWWICMLIYLTFWLFLTCIGVLWIIADRS